MAHCHHRREGRDLAAAASADGHLFLPCLGGRRALAAAGCCGVVGP